MQIFPLFVFLASFTGLCSFVFRLAEGVWKRSRALEVSFSPPSSERVFIDESIVKNVPVILWQFIQWCECYARCDWSLLMIYMDDVTQNSFVCFVQHGVRFWKCLWDYFALKASEILEKSSTGAIYKKEKWRNGYKKSSWLLKNA